MASCSNFNTLNQAEVDYSNLHSLVFTPRYVDGVRVLQQDDNRRYVGVLGLSSLDATPYRSRGGTSLRLESRRVAGALGGRRGQRGGEARNNERLRACWN